MHPRTHLLTLGNTQGALVYIAYFAGQFYTHPGIL